MKRKESPSKLKLNKQTIVNLEKKSMAVVFGGSDGTIPPPGTEKFPTGPCNG